MTTKEMFDYFVGCGLTPEGAAGLMGNLQAESGLKSTNLQNTYNKSLGMTDEEYTMAVDTGVWDFVNDKAGYGLAQWTYWSRKESLLNYAKSKGVSIGDEKMQLEFMVKELKGYKQVWKVLTTTNSIREASDIVLIQYEAPADQSEAMQELRTSHGQKIFDEVNKTKKDTKEITICIDAGHYAKYNRSPVNKNYYESDMNWKLHLLQKKYLEEYGFKVILTRKDKDTDLALQSRGKAAAGCNLFISDHSNASSNTSVDYVAVYHLTEDSTTKSDDVSKEIANVLAPVIAKTMGTKQGYKVLTRKADGDRNGDGFKNDNYYGVLHGARLVNVPGLILEHSFHSNIEMTGWLLNDSNLDKLAKAEAEAIAKYFGLTKTEQEVIYRVQVGAFRDKKNCDAMVAKVKEAGFDTYVFKANGYYKVQIGAFSSKSNAEKMLAKVKAAGFDAYIATK